MGMDDGVAVVASIDEFVLFDLYPTTVQFVGPFGVQPFVLARDEVRDEIPFGILRTRGYGP